MANDSGNGLVAKPKIIHNLQQTRVNEDLIA